MDPSKITRRFRILIIGRANAGKTTILRRVCDTRDNPEIYNCVGEKIDSAVLNASRERGEHDIENEMVFQSNPGFVFHDSCGFEAGSKSEFDKVKAFIARRSSKKIDLNDQLHVIWYCIPMDEASRSFTTGENNFFSSWRLNRNVQVIVLFTKFDALYDDAYQELKLKGVPSKDASEQAPMHAEKSFANGPQLKSLKAVRYPPKCHVCLPDMDKDGADCRPLIKCTAETLEKEEVQQLFVSTQHTHLELCMTYAIKKIVPDILDPPKTTEALGIIERLSLWFPHILMDNYDYDRGNDGPLPRDLDRARRLADARRGLDVDDDRDVAVACLFKELAINDADKLLWHHRDFAKIEHRLCSMASGSSPLDHNVQLISAGIIIFEYSFHVFDSQRKLAGKQKSVPSFIGILEQYIASPHAAVVRGAVSDAVQEYEEAVAPAARAYEGKASTGMAKPLKGKAQKALRSQAKAKLMETILEITLNHLLPRP